MSGGISNILRCREVLILRLVPRCLRSRRECPLASVSCPIPSLSRHTNTDRVSWMILRLGRPSCSLNLGSALIGPFEPEVSCYLSVRCNDMAEIPLSVIHAPSDSQPERDATIL